jgi:hypothetical protein
MSKTSTPENPTINNPWIQTGSGIAFDLINPTPDMVDFRTDVAGSLSRLPRFNGHLLHGPYSVAQHSVMGADALFNETGRRDLAAAFLLHDAHEAYIGDITTPVARALAIYAGAAASGGKDDLAAASACYAAVKSTETGIAMMKERADQAIHTAAGVPWPLPPDVRAAVKLMDLRMLVTEQIHLLGPEVRPWVPEGIAPLWEETERHFMIWSRDRSEETFRERLEAYLPNMPKQAF